MPEATNDLPSRQEVVLALRQAALDVRNRTQDPDEAGRWRAGEWELICNDYHKYAQYLDDLAYSVEIQNENRGRLISRARSMPFIPDVFWAHYEATP